MKTLSEGLEATRNLEGDPRWELVRRIVASHHFSKAERLSSFLLFVCRLSLEGRDDEISEQMIGECVFDRAPDYDPTIDGIVRSHALRLRQRLEQFFSSPEEADAPILLTIPRGAYIPVFLTRTLPEQEQEVESATPPTLDMGIGIAPTPGAYEEDSEASISRRRFRFVRFIWIGVVFASLAWTAASGIYLATHGEMYTRLSALVFGSSHPLWSRLFHRDQRTLIVAADSGLVMLQNLTNNRITLPDYAAGNYRERLSNGSPLPAAVLEDIGSRRYTSFVDVQTVTHLLRLAGVRPSNVDVKYARDIRAGDLKSGNTILIGSYEATPWIQMYEPRMNFYFQNDLKTGIFSTINRNPRNGEQASYDYDRLDKEHKVYGLVAFQPALNGPGDTLILEGQTMAGTEAATDFAFTDSYLLPFLAKIKRSDGSIPHFEVLVGSKSLNGDASHLEVLAYRAE